MSSENQTQDNPKPNSLDKTKKKWLMYGGGGLALFSFGLCLFGEALHLKHSSGETMSWVLYGTLSFVVINAGLAIFGQAVVFKSQLDYKKNRKKFGTKRYNNKGKSNNANPNANFNRDSRGGRKPKQSKGPTPPSAE